VPSIRVSSWSCSTSPSDRSAINLGRSGTSGASGACFTLSMPEFYDITQLHLARTAVTLSSPFGSLAASARRTDRSPRDADAARRTASTKHRACRLSALPRQSSSVPRRPAERSSQRARGSRIGGCDASPARPEGLRRPPGRKMPGLARHRTPAGADSQPAGRERAPSDIRPQSGCSPPNSRRSARSGILSLLSESRQ
jgi:hypothetical protein